MVAQQGYVHAKPFDEGFFQVSNLHTIHYEQYGKVDGKSVLYVHGGPGGSASYANTVFFNPDVYRVVLFDQRGAGKSLPAAELSENTSQLLLTDMEALRKHLHIPKWSMVFGGSWGSTLSLLYAQTHPEMVGSLILRGVDAMRKAELQFSRGTAGAARIFPQEYEAFIGYLSADTRHDPIAGYHTLVTSEDPEIRLAASKAWNEWDLSIGRLLPDESAKKAKTDLWHLQHARLEIHYFVNGCFIEEGQLLKPENLAKIKHIPCSMVNGRYDMFCPPQTAYDFHRGLPDSRLYIIPDAGHSAEEPGILRKLVQLCDEYAASTDL